MTERVAVIGAGSWGTAVATIVGATHPTTLWARSDELAASMRTTRENGSYLPGIELPDGLAVTSSLDEALAAHRHRVHGSAVARVPGRAQPSVRSSAGWLEAVVSLAKGIEMGTNLRMSQVVAEVLPGIRPGCSPDRTSLAKSPRVILRPASSPCPTTRSLTRVQGLVHTPDFRAYTGTDVVGCEIAGATKNVMAIAAGIGDGLGLGDNTRAVLITRGLAELGRLGVALGGKVLTFGGLAGVGDLVATCASPTEPEPDGRFRAWVRADPSMRSSAGCRWWPRA